jgi:hypothetical protein
MKTKIYTPRKSVIRGVEKQHSSRVLFDLDARSTLTFRPNGDKSTAHWTHDGHSHHIVINEEMVCLIDNADMLKKPIHRRKELQYLRAVHNHEVAHAIYTSRDFKYINAQCKKYDIPFRDVNLFEDARIEGLFRQRRPHKVSGRTDVNHEGSTTHPDTYGVRKFGWCTWEELAIETPRGAFLSFIKCEGTKVNQEKLESLWVAKFGNLHKGFEAAKAGSLGTKIYGYHSFLALWREVAGRGAERRYPTTESLIGLIRKFNKLFPYDSKSEPEMQPGIGGNDYCDAAEGAGETPHEVGVASGGGSASPEPVEEKVRPPAGQIEGVTDEKYGGPDESNEKVTKEALKKHGLSSAYFAWEE